MNGSSGRRPSFKDHLSQGESFEGLDLTRDTGSGEDITP